MELDGVGVTGPVTAPATGGWQTYTDVTAPNVTLSAGQHVMRVHFDGGAWNLNHITIAANPLPAPQNVIATPGAARITLSWHAVGGATGYTIRRSGSGGGPFTELAAGISATTYENTGLGDGATWYYTVAANGSPGVGAVSEPVSATTYTALESWRLANFGMITGAGAAADDADPDGDGWTNFSEYASGTVPNDAASSLKITRLEPAGDDLLVAFPSVAGRSYRVERSLTLDAGSWTTIQGAVAGTGGEIQIVDTDVAALPRRFYRVVVTR